jgi:hypothetical protein
LPIHPPHASVRRHRWGRKAFTLHSLPPSTASSTERVAAASLTAAITIISALVFIELKPSDGDAVSSHKSEL